jgi:hypothetical protein
MMKRALLAAAIAAALAACALNDAMPNLREGMSPAEVTAIMGAPTSQTRQGDMLRMAWTNRLVSGWAWDRTDAHAIFQDDRLASWGTGEVRQGQPAMQAIESNRPMVPCAFLPRHIRHIRRHQHLCRP